MCAATLPTAIRPVVSATAGRSSPRGCAKPTQQKRNGKLFAINSAQGVALLALVSLLSFVLLYMTFLTLEGPSTPWTPVISSLPSSPRTCTPSDDVWSSGASRRRAKSFLLVFMGHSGSTAIITALKQHTDTLIEGLEPVDHGDRARNTAEALRFADEFFENGRVQNKTAGFKIRPYHLLQNPKGWADLLHKHDTRILWNYRSNTFKQAVGHYPISFQKSTAAYEGLVLSNRSKENGPKPVIQRIRIDNIRGLSELVRGRMRGEAEVKVALQKLAEARKNTDNNECILPLSYEDLLRDERGAILRAQAYLGLGMDEQLLPLRAKATLDNLCELLENFREVCQAFFGCPELRWMMEDSTNNCRCSTFDSSRLFVSKEFCPGDGTN